ncbi:MAG: nitroreductase family protein, partial [Chloroflexi bacterium]|nr:nitroreductase family protein [Chloroflexota bacterium]
FETLNTPEFKASYNVPEHYDLVATLTLGYKSDERLSEMERKPALIFNR